LTIKKKAEAKELHSAEIEQHSAGTFEQKGFGIRRILAISQHLLKGTCKFFLPTFTQTPSTISASTSCWKVYEPRSAISGNRFDSRLQSGRIAEQKIPISLSLLPTVKAEAASLAGRRLKIGERVLIGNW